MFDTPTFVQWLALALAIFVSPGPKDLLILRQALLGRPSVELIAVGFISDAVLIWLGISCLSAVFAAAPYLQTAALWFGACLLFGHSLLAARSAILGGNTESNIANANALESGRKSYVALLSVSFLNPVAWLDAVLVVGTAGAALPAGTKFSYGLGASFASFVWFAVLVMGARGVSRWMRFPRAWQLLDAFVAIAMFILCIKVASGLI
jgi:L-lysine exporter family protein LysE/ArgO